MPTDVSRLLGAAVEPARAVASEPDEWDARLAALAKIGEYDALAVVASEPVPFTHMHNIAEPRALADAAADASLEATRRKAAVQVRAPMSLADGRSANEIMVAPLTAIVGVEGVLLALRTGRGFSAADAIRASGLGMVVAVELVRAAAARQDARTVRESLALFELARVGLGAHELGERLLVMVEIVARSLGHDVAQLWLLRGGGSLRLRAAHPRESLVLEIARPRDHVGLARVLDGESLRVKGPSLRSWIRRTTRELIVAPLRAGDDVSGVLALGRFSREYSDEDCAMAAQCADVLAKIVRADVTLRRAIATAARETAETTEDEDSLTGS